MTPKTRPAAAAMDVVTVTHNSAAVIGAMLASLPLGMRAVVVDNASGDESPAIARRADAHVVASPNNVGFGGACNLGANAGAAPLILFLNPDCRIQPGALDALAAAAKRHPHAAAFNPRLVDAAGKFSLKRTTLLAPGERFPGNPNGDCELPVLSGAALLVRRTAFEAIGGFDANIFLYYDDDDLCRRLRERGWKLMHVHDAVVVHEAGTSSGVSLATIRAKAKAAIVSQHYVSRKYGLPFSFPAKRVFAQWRLAVARLSGNEATAARMQGRIEGLRQARKAEIKN
jgi:GT2 family glycosyltransferase